MKTVNMHDAKTHLSKLVEAATKGEPFVIAKSGKPLVKVVVLEGAEPKRLGFLAGKANIPDDFDDMGSDDVQAMFVGSDE